MDLHKPQVILRVGAGVNPCSEQKSFYGIKVNLWLIFFVLDDYLKSKSGRDIAIFCNFFEKKA